MLLRIFENDVLNLLLYTVLAAIIIFGITYICDSECEFDEETERREDRRNE